MNDFKRLAKELEGGEKSAALRSLGSTPEGKRLEGMVDGAALEKALQSGDAASLKQMLGALLATPEGRRLAEDVGKIMGK